MEDEDIVKRAIIRLSHGLIGINPCNLRLFLKTMSTLLKRREQRRWQYREVLRRQVRERLKQALHELAPEEAMDELTLAVLRAKVSEDCRVLDEAALLARERFGG